MKTMNLRAVLAGLAAVAVAGVVWADEPTTKTSATNSPSVTTSDGSAHYRVSTLEGFAVKNSSGENLGRIKDMVIDLKTGKIRYVALEFGGFLGVGDKLFAVPWQVFQLQGKGNDQHLMLNVPKDRLKNAPGFDKAHWPDMADPLWNTDIDTYYAPSSARR